MFDFNKLADMSKLANQAKQVQERHEEFQSKQLELLNKISSQISEVISLLRNKQ